MAREQFVLSDNYSDLIHRLMGAGELSSKKAVVENALVILGWAMSEVQKGRKIATVAADGSEYSELALPALEGARTQGILDAVRTRNPAPRQTRSSGKVSAAVLPSTP